ncbi:hypothetical protein P8452_13272 [Trifolium repens]|nr:hypothetical protein P8452_13272 [Trifolium repens]
MEKLKSKRLQVRFCPQTFFVRRGLRRIHRKVPTTNIAHSSNVEQIGSSEVENSIAIDIQLSIGSNYGAAENEGYCDIGDMSVKCPDCGAMSYCECIYY